MNCDIPLDESLRNATLECYRSKRLKGRHQVELGVYSFFDCLQECMKRFRRNCRSVEYSSLKRFCRFSSFDGIGKNQSNLVDDKNYDFYKFMWCKLKIILLNRNMNVLPLILKLMARIVIALID